MLEQWCRGVRVERNVEFRNRVHDLSRQRDRNVLGWRLRLHMQFGVFRLQRFQLRRMRVRHARLLRHVLRDDSQQRAHDPDALLRLQRHEHQPDAGHERMQRRRRDELRQPDHQLLRVPLPVGQREQHLWNPLRHDVLLELRRIQ